jgi:Protein of unknown function (DUF3237)
MQSCRLAAKSDIALSQMRIAMPTIAPPQLEHLCDLAITIDAPIEVGATPLGLRRIIPITGGVVTGAQFNGRVLNAGADFQLLVSGHTISHLDARYVIELHDGTRVFVQNTALRVTNPEAAARLLAGQAVSPDEVYFRCQPRFETAAPQWAWLNERQFVGSGLRLPDAVHLSFYQLC